MIAGIGGVVTSATKSIEGRHTQRIVYTSHPRNLDRYGVKYLFAARDGLAVLRFVAAPTEALPILIEVEDMRVERRACGIHSKRIIHSKEEFRELLRECKGTARRGTGIQMVGLLIEVLRGENAFLESNDLVLLVYGWSAVGLRMAESSRRRTAFQGWARVRPT